jgi:uncharacterized protein
MTIAVKPRIIVDTNTLVSGIIFKGQLIRKVMTTIVDEYQLVFSYDTWDELVEVFQRDKFDQYLSLSLRLKVIAELAERAELVESKTLIADCRDPSDNKFLALAFDGQVDTIISGDQDLKTLHPWRGVQIISADVFAHRINLR